MFAVLVPDNLKPVVDKADRLEPRWNREWLEYAQARGLVVDPARVRSPQDKGRVENGVKFVQVSFFAGEQFAGHRRRAAPGGGLVPGAGRDAGARHHPAAACGGVRAAWRRRRCCPRPEQPYRVPAWSEAKVQRDFHVRAQNAFYSVPYGLIGPAGHGAGGRDAGEDLPPRPGDPHPSAAAGRRAGRRTRRTSRRAPTSTPAATWTSWRGWPPPAARRSGSTPPGSWIPRCRGRGCARSTR